MRVVGSPLCCATLVAALLIAPSAVRADGASLAACERVYDDCVANDAVDYARVAAHPERRACAEALAAAIPPQNPEGAIAFWVDAYNLLSMLAVAEDGRRWSARQDGRQVFRDHRFLVA